MTHEGSLNSKLRALALDEVTWLESTLDTVIDLSRRVTLASRYPAEMRDYRFTCRTFTAVSATKLGEVAYLLRVERIA